MKFLSLLLALLLISACASTPQKSERIFFPVSHADILLPATPPAFIKGDTHLYSEPELGYSMRYSPAAGADTHLDVYIYPLVLPNNFSLADALEGHFNASLKEISMANPSAQVKSVSTLGVETPSAKTCALKAMVELYSQGTQKSYLYLAVIEDVLIKARFTEKFSRGLEKQTDSFFLSLIKDTRFANPNAHKHPFSQTILVGPVLAQEEPSSFMGYAMGYLESMQKSIEQGAYLNTFEREYAAINVGLGFVEHIAAEKSQPDKTPEAAKIYPNAQIPQMLNAQKSGLLREYVWDYMRRPYWQQPADLKLDAFKIWKEKNLIGHKGLLDSPAAIGWQMEPKNISKAKTKNKPDPGV